MSATTLTLTDFLLARITEDEQAARSVYRSAAWHLDQGEHDLALVGGGKTIADFDDDYGPTAALHIIRWNPERVLADCEAKRRLIEMHVAEYDETRDDMGWTLVILAAVYADHPDYRDEWRP